MKSLLLIVFFLICSLKMFAQHCPFDNLGLIVIEIETETPKDDLSLILTYIDYNGIETKTECTKNRKVTDEKRFTESNYDIKYLHFDFANDALVASLPMDRISTAYLTLIGQKGNSLVEKLTIPKKNVFDLHANYGETWHKFSADYSPTPWNEFNQLITIRLNE